MHPKGSVEPGARAELFQPGNDMSFSGNLKIEDQEASQQQEALRMKRKLRSRNAAIRQSMSQKTAQVIGDSLTAQNASGHFGPNRGIVGIPCQYQNMLIGDQSVAQITVTSQTQNDQSVQDAQSIKNLNKTLNKLANQANDQYHNQFPTHRKHKPQNAR